MHAILKASLTRDAHLHFFVAAILLVCSVALIIVGVFPFRPRSYISNFTLYLAAWIMFVAPAFLYHLFLQRPDSPFAFAREYLSERKAKHLDGLPVIIAAIIFMPMFSAMKSSIPNFTEYRWDETFIEADRVLFGQDAWLTLQPYVGFPIVTSAISFFYHAWFLLIYSGTIYFAIYAPSFRRTYFFCFFSSWFLIGIVLATVFASVGPCFLDPLFGLSDFSGQMEYLRRVDEKFPVLVLDVQQRLLAWHSLGDHGIGRGITAMPSMHVALATLFWLAIRQAVPKLGWLFFSFLVVTFIGSIHLAYHYAVDGIVSFVCAVLIWKVARSLSADHQLRQHLAQSRDSEISKE